MINALVSQIVKKKSLHFEFCIFLLCLFCLPKLGQAEDIDWNLNLSLVRRFSTASFYEKGEDHWVSQLSGGGFLGIAFQRDISFVNSNRGLGWDLAANLFWDPVTAQSLPNPDGDQFDPLAKYALTEAGLMKYDSEIFSRLFYSLYAGPTLKVVAPFVGFGISRSNFFGDTFVTHPTATTPECQRGVEERNAELIKFSCEPMHVTGTATYIIKRIGLLFRHDDDAGGLNVIFAHQPPVYFEISGVTIRYEARYIFGFEWEF